MAPTTQMLVPTKERDVENSSSEGESPEPSIRRRGLLALAAVGALGFVALAAGAGTPAGIGKTPPLHAGPSGAARPHPSGAPRILTVRELLESDELMEVAMGNLVANGGVQRADGMPMEHEELKGKVRDSLKNIHAFINERDPESARQLEVLHVSEDEKTAVMDRLSFYSHPVLMKLTKEITAAYIKHNGQMHEELATTVLAHAGDLQSIAQVLLPVDREGGEPVGMPLSVDMVQRRLQMREVDTVSGIMPQARTLLEGLEVVLGDKMPKAPSRLLFELTTASLTNSLFGSAPATPTAAPTFPIASSLLGSIPTMAPWATTPTTPGVAQPGLMACMQKAVPNPVEVAACLANKSKTMMASMKGFIAKSKSAVGLAPKTGTTGQIR